MQRILPWLSKRWAAWFGSPPRRNQSDQFTAQVYVRALEERRVLNAAPIAAPPTPAPPATSTPTATETPPPTTTVTLDSQQNLLIQDTSSQGQHDAWTIKANAAEQRYEIHAENQTLVSDIATASGSGTDTLYIPFAAVAGEKVIVAAAAGDDALTVDFSAGAAPHTIEFLGGTGHDSLTLLGGAMQSVSYTFSSAANGQIQTSLGPQSSTISLDSVEPIHDQLAAAERSFTFAAGSHVSLATTAPGSTQLSLASDGCSVTFVDPSQSLSIAATGVTINRSWSPLAKEVELHASEQFHLAAGGEIVQGGGRLSIFAPDLQIDGNITSPGGHVALDALTGGTLLVTGRIDVSNHVAGSSGGTVHLLGEQVELLDQAVVDAAGDAGGGTILVGGDYQGKNPSIRNALRTRVAADVVLQADALRHGDGGTIIVWADDVALVPGSGNIRARGGTLSGNGGLIETSSKGYLYVDGAADASAAQGAGGTWLLDPRNVSIVAGLNVPPVVITTFTPVANNSEVKASAIEAALLLGTNVVITTGTTGSQAGNITVDAPISVVLGVLHPSLTLQAAQHVIINAPITATTGQLDVFLLANDPNGGGAGGDGDTTAGNVIIKADITTNGGSFTASGVNITATLTSLIDTSPALGGAGAVEITGSSLGTSANPLQLSIGAAHLALSATAGDIYINFASGDFNTIQLDTLSATGARIVSLRTADGNFNFNELGAGVDLADDRVLITTGGTGRDIAFSGTTQLSAASVALTATGDITSSTDATILETTAAAGISLSGASLGASDDPLVIAPGTGDVSLTATSGDIYLEYATGDLVGSRLTVSAAGANRTISLATQDGDILLDSTTTFAANTANDNFILTAAGTAKSIVFSGSATLVARSAELTASGAISSTSLAAIDINTSVADGAITLAAGTGIGAASPDRLNVSANGGVVSASTTSGNIYLEAAGPLRLGEIVTGSGADTVEVYTLGPQARGLTIAAVSDTDDNWVLNSSGDIRFDGGKVTAASFSAIAGGSIVNEGADAVVIDAFASAGAVTLVAKDIGTSAARIRVRRSGDLNLTTTGGDLYVDLDGGDLATSQLTHFEVPDGRIAFLRTTAGSIVVDSTAGFVNISDSNLRFTAGGSGSTLTIEDTATLVARSIELRADSAISGGGAADDIDTSATNGSILLRGASLGAADPGTLLLRPGSGDLDLTATAGDIWIRLAAGDLATSQIENLNAAGAGVTISLETTDGHLTLDSLTGFNANTHNDAFRLVAAGADRDVTFGDATLQAASAEVIASRSIVSGADTNVDLETTGNIDLQAVAGIGGDAGAELTLISGGQVFAATTDVSLGDIYLTSPNTLTLGSLSTGLGRSHTVKVSTAGATSNLQLVAASNTDDHWTLNSDGDVAFQGSGGIVAKSVILVATGAVTSDGGNADIDLDCDLDFATGSIKIDAASLGSSAAALQLNADGGQLDLYARSGDLGVNFTALDLSLAQFTRLRVDGVGQDIGLSTSSGHILLNDSGATDLSGTADDNWFVSAGGSDRNIQFDDTWTLAALSADLKATGQILSATGTTNDIVTTAGLSLFAEDGIGGSANPLRFLAGSIAAETTGATGHVYLESPSTLTLFAVQTDAATQQIIDIRTVDSLLNHLLVQDASGTNDIWSLSSSGDIRFMGAGSLTAASASLSAAGAMTSGTAGTDVDTSAANGAITLVGKSLGTSLNPLALNAGTGSLVLTTTGVDVGDDIYATLTAGDLVASRVSLYTERVGATIGLQAAAGAIVLDNLSNFFPNTIDDRIELATGGSGHDITFGTGVTLRAQSVRLEASGAIVGGDAANDIEAGGSAGIELVAVHAIGTADNLLMVATPGLIAAETSAADGNIALGSSTTLRLGTISTAGASVQQVQIATLTPGFTLQIEAASLTNDVWTLNSAGGIAFGAAGSLRASQATLTAVGAVTSGSAARDIDTATAGGRIAISGNTLGAAGNALALAPGAGLLNLAATAGNLYVDIFGADVAASQFESLSAAAAGAQVALQVREGALTFDDLAGFVNLGDDALSFSARDDVTFANATPLVGATVAITSDGKIASSGTGVKIDTSLLAGTIVLDAQDGVGDGVSSLGVQAGAGLVNVTTRSAGGDIWLTSTGLLRIGGVNTVVGTQVVNLTTQGSAADVNFAVDNLGDDAWQLAAAGNIGFEGAIRLAAASANFTAGGTITGGTSLTDIDTQTHDGNITLAAASIGEPVGTGNGALGLAPGNGQLDFTAETGDIWIDVTTGGLNFARVTNLNAKAVGATIALSTAAGPINLANLSGVNAANDHLQLLARGVGGDISFGSQTLRVATATLDASGSILAGNGLAINTSTGGAGGTVSLTAGGSIASQATPFQAQTGRLNAQSAGDQHYSGSLAPLRLGNVQALGGGIFLEGGTTFLIGTATAPQVVARNETLLGGVGTVMGNLAVTERSIVSPGLELNQAGRLTVLGALTLEPGTTLLFDLNAPYRTPGADFDQLSVQAGFDVSGVFLQLEGGLMLQSTIGDIVLIDVAGGSNITGNFVRPGVGGLPEPIREAESLRFGSFRGGFSYLAGDGNDVGLRNLSLSPPIQPMSFRPPEFRLATPTRPEPPPLLPSVPQALPKAIEPPPLEGEAETLSPRRVQVRLLIPIDDEGGFVEETVLELDVEWLTNLSGLFRALPDDRYRIYLLLEGGEERRVMEVVVLDGKPHDPSELRQRSKAAPAPVEPAEPPASELSPEPAQGAPEPGPMDDASLLPPLQEQSFEEDSLPAPRRFSRFGAATAGGGIALAVAASGQAWSERVDRAVQQHSTARLAPGSRWWRWLNRNHPSN